VFSQSLFLGVDDNFSFMEYKTFLGEDGRSFSSVIFSSLVRAEVDFLIFLSSCEEILDESSIFFGDFDWN
jgi:hypothetical protein